MEAVEDVDLLRDFFTLMWQLVEERFEIRWDIRKPRINTRAALSQMEDADE